MKKVLIVLFAVVSVSLFGFLIVTFITPPGISTHLNASAIGTITQTVTPGSIDYTYIPPVVEGEEDQMEPALMDNDKGIKTPFVPATEIDKNPESITVFVNKEYNLPKDYVPKDMVVPNVLFNHSYADERQKMQPDAASALEELFEAAKKEGLTLYGISAYRSYERQRKIFLNNIVKKGKNYTLRYSAVPGTSEHQTGLAIDVSTKGLRFRLVSSFANTAEGKWLADNAHHYGYIIRYPKGKYEITGYSYEPWHIRYVGQDLANHLYTNDLTLDEYYKYTPSEGFNFEKEYASLINYVPPVVTTIPKKDDPALLDEENLLNGEDQLTDENLNDEENIEDDLAEEKPDEGLAEEENPDKDVIENEETDGDIIDEGEAEEDMTDNETPSDLSAEEVDSPASEVTSGEKHIDKEPLEKESNDKFTENMYPYVQTN